MKWGNHIAMSAAAAYAATDSLPASFLCMLGSVLPDLLEGRPQEDEASYQIWKKHHRGISHWAALYLAPMLACFFLATQSGYPPTLLKALRFEHLFGAMTTNPSNPLFLLLLGTFLGGSVLHLLQDMCCGKIPVLVPHQRVGARLFAVGSKEEYLITSVVVLGLVLMSNV